MRKVSAQNSPDGESIPNFAITDNNQKVLYSKHVNGRVIAGKKEKKNIIYTNKKKKIEIEML